MADKALVLGINNYKNVQSLRGCVNDTETMRSILVEVFKFPEKNVRILTDGQVIKSQVRKQLAWLFQGAKPGDRVVLHFSGHGSYVADKDGDEDDGRDELIALYDMDFDDPDTYLLDDELGDWTKTKPPGVELTVVLDNCNSGTGTRMLMAASPTGELRNVEVDPETTVKRSMSAIGATRSLDAVGIAARAIRPDNEDMVRVRFIDPPEAVKDEVESARARALGSRGFVKVEELNHVLLTACRADQTAADATIDGRPSGAFTYYLGRVIRSGGASMSRQTLIDKLEAALREGHFTQVPQLEGPGDGALFGMNDGDDTTEAPSPPGPRIPPRKTPYPTGTLATGKSGTASSPSLPSEDVPPPGGAIDLSLSELVDKLTLLDPESRRRILDLYERRLASTPGAGRAVGATSVTGRRYLVAVHGICRHPPGYSNEWWQALQPFTTEFGTGALGDTRREVLWSDLVNERGIRARGLDDEREALYEQIRETLQDRMDRHAIESGPRSEPGEAPRALSDTRALLSIPGLDCIDDFLVYMTDDSVRAQVLRRFTDVVRPLLEGGAEVDVISHSWGTVVAYEGLRELADVAGLAAATVRNFFTVGAALSIGAVKSTLRPANRDGARPSIVRRWVNLDAQGDPVGGPLQGRPYAVDFDFPNLVPFGCSSFLGIVDPGCAHGSYFKVGNFPVSRDIFGHFVNEA